MSPRGVGHFAAWCMMAALLAAAPYTKVEESFNVQAMHDFIFGGGDIVSIGRNSNNSSSGGGLATFDHHAFPGVVPRTCLGALTVASIAAVPIRVAGFLLPLVQRPLAALGAALLGDSAHFEEQQLTDAMVCLFICRLVLGSLFVRSLWFLCDGLDFFVRSKGWKHDDKNKEQAESNNNDDDEGPFSRAGECLSFLVAVTQFHTMFYASRPLPNTFAGIGVNLAFGALLRNRPKLCILFLAVTTCVFRADMAVLSLPVCVLLLFLTSVGVLGGVFAGLGSMLLAVAVSVPFDSLFWASPVEALKLQFRPRWPEFAVLYFNTAENRSSEWGVSPWHWYWSSALPRGLAGGMLFLAAAAVARRAWLKPRPQKKVASAAADSKAVVVDKKEQVVKNNKKPDDADAEKAAAERREQEIARKREERKQKALEKQQQQQEKEKEKAEAASKSEPAVEQKKQQQDENDKPVVAESTPAASAPAAAEAPDAPAPAPAAAESDAAAADSKAAEIARKREERKQKAAAKQAEKEAKPAGWVEPSKAANPWDPALYQKKPAAAAPEPTAAVAAAPAVATVVDGKSKEKKESLVVAAPVAAPAEKPASPATAPAPAPTRNDGDDDDAAAVSPPLAPSPSSENKQPLRPPRKERKEKKTEEQRDSAPAPAAAAAASTPTANNKQQAAAAATPANFLYFQLSQRLFLLTTLPCLLFVALYSLLPHKELRFILPCFPVFVCPAAYWMSQLFSLSAGLRNGGPPSALTHLVLLAGIVGSLALCAVSTTANAATYPGGEAIRAVNNKIIARSGSSNNEKQQKQTFVFIDAFAGMTGVTRFAKLRQVGNNHLALHRVIYVKNEQIFNLSDASVRSAKSYSNTTLPPPFGFDFMIVRAEDAKWHVERNCGGGAATKCRCKSVAAVEQFSRLNLVGFVKSGMKATLIQKTPFLDILERSCKN